MKLIKCKAKSVGAGESIHKEPIYICELNHEEYELLFKQDRTCESQLLSEDEKNEG